jgi:hypothetical protein
MPSIDEFERLFRRPEGRVAAHRPPSAIGRRLCATSQPQVRKTERKIC